jgi:methionyl-tRNA synthetase
MRRPLIITLPPPTPNGGLHVGHLSGPFLAADVFRKHAQQLGHRCLSVTYSDANQSYVRVTAERQNRAPDELARHYTRDILETLAIYGIDVDDYRYPDVRSASFVRDFFLDLYRKGVLVRRPMPFFYAHARQQFLDEAGVSGFCPRCLAACKCGICEACSFPNTAATLISPRDTIRGSAQLEIRMCDVLVLETECWREPIRDFYAGNRPFRTRYLWTVADALSAPLPAFPVTVPGEWGIKAECSDIPGQVINPWAEVMAQLLFGFRSAKDRLEGMPAGVINFFGFDNSYFYAIVHAGLYLAAGEAEWLPAATVINEFYNLEHSKFSTSGNHVLWARDLAMRHSPDAIRFYAAYNTPGFEKSNFAEREMCDVITRELVTSWRELVAAYHARLDADNSAAALSAAAKEHADVAFSRIGASYSLERFHLRQAAEDLLHLLKFVRTQLTTHDMTAVDAAYFLKVFAQAAYPIMPLMGAHLFKILTGTQLARVDTTPKLRSARLPMDLFEDAASAVTPVAF